MGKIGVVEGFFGPEWPHAARLGYAEFIARTGGGFYIYAPKRDQRLRKAWREDWGQEYGEWLTSVATHFRGHGVTFGVGLSPFGLGATLSDADRTHLREKLAVLKQAGVELLGLFFDDMPSDANLAPAQMACLAEVRQHFSGKIVFCPSYYSYDPILEKVFGTMPAGYWEHIARETPADVDMCWTGPKVISSEIGADHLREVTALLKRAPFLWENLYANDGPRNCKFLKLRPFEGRAAEVLDLCAGIGFNMMNQPELSKIVYLSSVFVLEDGIAPAAAFERAVAESCSPALASFLRHHGQSFLEQGLDKLDDKEGLITQLDGVDDPAADEIRTWLRGGYVVGPECLTD